MIDIEAVNAALDRVADPELDRSVLALDFVRVVEVDGADVRVELRLPTYWCSPNFAYLMVGDAQAALEALPGVGAVRVELVDHFVADAVTRGVARALPFSEAFPEDGNGDLSDLRRKFRLKAFLFRQEPVLRAVRAALGDEATCGLPLGDGHLPAGVDGAEWAEYLGRRDDLGMDSGPRALAFTDAQGAPLDPERLVEYLRLSRSVRVSLQSNAEFCTGLLAARYGGGVEAWQRQEVAA